MNDVGVSVVSQSPFSCLMGTPSFSVLGAQRPCYRDGTEPVKARKGEVARRPVVLSLLSAVTLE